MSFQQIILLLTAYKYLFLFPIAVVEGPIITVIAGFLSSLGYLNIFIAYAVIVASDFVGDILYYIVGMFAKKSFIARYGYYVGATSERLAKLDEHFRKHPGKILLFGKFSHVFGAPTLIAAGMARMNMGRFLLFTIVGTIPKSLIFLLIGYFFGSSYVLINNYIYYGSYIALAAGIILVGIYYLIAKNSKKYL